MKVLGKKDKAKLKKIKNIEKRKSIKHMNKIEKVLSSVILKNLPFTATEEDIKMILKQFGRIENINLLRRKNGCPLGKSIVKFHDVKSAEDAVKMGALKNFKGRKVFVDWANEGCDEILKIIAEDKSVNEGDSDNASEVDVEDDKSNNLLNVIGNVKSDDVGYRDSESELEQEFTNDGEYKLENPEEEENNYLQEDTVDIKEEKVDVSEEARQEKSQKQSKHIRNIYQIRQKRGRIIVRNLSFKITEEKLQSFFKSYGEIIEVKLLKKPDGNLIGCGFVEFQEYESAERAILEKNGVKLLGRPVICDWSLPKNEYLQLVQKEIESASKEEYINNIKIKEEPCSDTELEVKNEFKSTDYKETLPSDSDWDNENDIKEIEVFDIKEEKLSKEEEEDDDDYDDDESFSYDENENDSDISHSKARKGNVKAKINMPEVKKPMTISNDVTEGCTVFVKNIPFSATKEELRKCMKRFGPIYYALICVDRLTEHSKGSGFVKFRNKEDAEKCIAANGQLSIGDQSLDVLPAMAQNDIKNMNDKKKEKKVKDNRRLYLVKEGVIVAGSPASKDVSVADMEQRLKIEQWKTQMLKNLNMFVSNSRLVVYNIPLSWTDKDVRNLFLQHGGRGAVIREARVMRNLKDVDNNGLGRSKEYAFVRFTEHGHALRALRNINNNPNIFTKAKRPIVTFSIENKSILNLKQKRLVRSRAKGMGKNDETNHNKGSSEVNYKHSNERKSWRQKNKFQKNSDNRDDVEGNQYTGVIAQPGSKKLRSKFNLKSEAVKHMENVKKNKQKEKFKRRMKIGIPRRPQEVMPKSKKKMNQQNDSFSELVDKYKRQMSSFENQKRWYE